MKAPKLPAPPRVLPPLGPPHYRGPAGDTTDAATVAAVARLQAIRETFKKGNDDEMVPHSL